MAEMKVTTTESTTWQRPSDDLLDDEASTTDTEAAATAAAGSLRPLRLQPAAERLPSAVLAATRTTSRGNQTPLSGERQGGTLVGFSAASSLAHPADALVARHVAVERGKSRAPTHFALERSGGDEAAEVPGSAQRRGAAV